MPLNVLIVCGGVSAEHEISILTARNVLNALDRSKFNPILIAVSRAGIWYYLSDEEILKKNEDFDVDCGKTLGLKPVTLIRLENGAALISQDGALISRIDIAFPLVHGTMGEDGTMQGLFEIMGIAYVGSNVLGSALAMDKITFKKVMAYHQIPIVPFIEAADSIAPSYSEVCKILDSTILFVKPSIMGSSVGVSKVKDEEQYKKAIAVAFSYCNQILIERFIDCREIECAVLGNEEATASTLGEISPTHEFYSYEAKYLDPNGAVLTIPSQLPQEVSQQIQQMAIKAFHASKCSGLARADFFVSKDMQFYINEINTLPGFTSISMYPKLRQYDGISYSDLITELLYLGVSAHKKRIGLCLAPESDLQ